MKKSRLICVVLAIAMIAGITGLASAAQDVANTSQKGSLMVFPKIDIRAQIDPTTNLPSNKDTIIMISNDYSTNVNVQCYWVDSNNVSQDFSFKITKKQPVWFSAETGLGTVGVSVSPFTYGTGVGELKCWAVNRNGDAQISFNHLWGTAKVIDFQLGTAFEYNSWNFAARGVNIDPAGTIVTGEQVGTPGTLDLTGNPDDYDGCPKYLLVNFPAVSNLANQNTIRLPDGFVRFDDVVLNISFCKEDVTQDGPDIRTKLKFTIWNEDEVKYTGAFACAKCWYENLLGAIDPRFLFQNLHTNFGMLRVKGVESNLCPGSQHMGIIGLSSDIMLTVPAVGAPGVPAVVVSGTTANGAGKRLNAPGFILWDPEDTVIPELD